MTIRRTSPMDTMKTLAPLDGIRVLDFSHYLSASTGTMILGDLGADVIKIENALRGDDYRRIGPVLDGHTVGFSWANRNKRGMALDLRSDAGRQAAVDLALQADVLVENFSTGVMEKFGLGHERLLDLNPRLVYCSIPGYARKGTLADRPGFDPVVQAESGMISLTGHPGTEGVRTGTPIVDLSAGFLASTAIVSALLARTQSGIGQYVELSLYDTAVALTSLPILGYLATGESPTRHGNASREAAPTDIYQTANGPIYIACPSESLFSQLVRHVLEYPDLMEDPRFHTNSARMRNAEALREAIEATLKQHPKEYWAQRLRSAKVPGGIPYDIPEVLNSSEFTQRELLKHTPQPNGTSYTSIAMPYRFGRSALQAATPPPTLGQHTEDVLREVLGYSQAQISAITAPSPANES